MVSLDGNGHVLNAKTLSGFKARPFISSECKKFTLKRQDCYVEQSGLRLNRTINRFIRTDGSCCRYYIVNYRIVNLSKNQELQTSSFTYHAPPHGNSKNKDPFVRTKPSVLNAIHIHGKNVKPKHIINKIEEDAGGAIASNSLSDVVRNRRQVIKCNTFKINLQWSYF